MATIASVIVEIGECFYSQIPDGELCRECPLLGKEFGYKGWTPYCRLSHAGLNYSSDRVFKEGLCPKGEKTGWKGQFYER